MSENSEGRDRSPSGLSDLSYRNRRVTGAFQSAEIVTIAFWFSRVGIPVPRRPARDVNGDCGMDRWLKLRPRETAFVEASGGGFAGGKGYAGFVLAQ